MACSLSLRSRTDFYPLTEVGTGCLPFEQTSTFRAWSPEYCLPLPVHDRPIAGCSCKDGFAPHPGYSWFSGLTLRANTTASRNGPAGLIGTDAEQTAYSKSSAGSKEAECPAVPALYRNLTISLCRSGLSYESHAAAFSGYSTIHAIDSLSRSARTTSQCILRRDRIRPNSALFPCAG